MKAISLFVAILAFGFTLAATDAEAAKRLGGGRSSGMQRQVTPDKAPSATPSQPAAGQQAPGTTAQPQPNRSWMGPLAGLAAGIGLAALASHFGFGEELASALAIGLLVLAIFAVIGFVMRRRAASGHSAIGDMGAVRYATNPSGPIANNRPYESYIPAGADTAPVGAARNIPPGFDVAAFVRNAKVNFIRLQTANDAGNLDDIREFTTPEMFAEIRMNIAERGNVTQQTDVVRVDADILDVTEEGDRYIASVRFQGLIREDKEGTAEPIDEIWHLVKPRNGASGWVLAGIQQTQ
jgi:predicted lipid-binding transport protein (Tim44 family)